MALDKDFLLIVTSSEIGTGETDLGAKLTELLFKVFSESEVLPGKIIFLNSGIFLTTEGSPVAGKLKVLEERGTEIVSCITCLKYHERMQRIVVGLPGDMKDTVAAITGHGKVVTL